MIDRKPDRYVETWETVAVTALPAGWRNVYDHNGEATTGPCPAVLLQEHRMTTACWDVQRPDGSYMVRAEDRPAKPPYETRAVFADYDGAVLCPADDAENYVRTLGPGEEP